MFDEEVSATFPIAGGDIFDLRRISGTLTDGLQRFQQDPMTIGPVLTGDNFDWVWALLGTGDAN